ncbi:MAG: hypothetical protein AMJ61_08500 [Desulfobacterales bacterium SG8_35_2]|jgi:hypothetical protein|nr:MAG: hypothetical protein AMJ61_08500 [Desulfobacterales bacterium SG8_35_2]
MQAFPVFYRRPPKGLADKNNKYLSGKKLHLTGSLMKRSLLILAVAVLLPGFFYSAAAAEIRAFHNVNQFAFKQIFGLPSLDNSPLTEAGKWRMNLIANISNTYDIENGATEQIINDVETFRGSLLVSFAPRDNWQLSLEVPYISHDGGFLDDFIYDWHDFFNMSQNGRSKENSDLLHISYLSGAGASFELSDSQNGIGDIRINGAYTRPWGNRALIFSTELKLPTGDYEKLTGSGGYDFSMGLTINDPQSLGKYRITLFGGLAGLLLGDIDGELAAIQKNFALAGRMGIGWQATKLIQLKLQLDAHSALYDSDLKQIGDFAMQLVFGGSLTFSDDVYLDISIAEDINTATAVDVAFQLGLVVTF